MSQHQSARARPPAGGRRARACSSARASRSVEGRHGRETAAATVLELLRPPIPGRLRLVPLLTMVGDLAAISLAFEGASRLRPFLSLFLFAQGDASQRSSLGLHLAPVLLLWTVVGSSLGLYRPRRTPRGSMKSTAARLAVSMLLFVVLAIVALFFGDRLDVGLSRSFGLTFAALGAVAVLANRSLVLWMQRLAERRRRERVLLVGGGRGVKALISRLEKAARQQVEICGVVVPAGGESAALGNPVPVVGTLPELSALINRYQAHRVIAVEREVPAAQLRACVSVCTRMGVTFSRTTELLETASARVGITEIGDTRLLEVRGVEFTRAQEAVKRGIDVVLATLLLVLLSPLLLALAAAIRLGSAGPALYVAPRVGRGGRHFPFFKFRSMVADAESRREVLKAKNEREGHLFKMRWDPRITPVGRLMRRFSLDELPQLLNVLRGEMSLVGPRPLPAEDLDADGLSREYRSWAKERSRVLPGITGLWQVRGRSNLEFEDMLRFDVAYVRTWSLWQDCKILLETIPAVIKGTGAC